MTAVTQQADPCPFCGCSYPDDELPAHRHVCYLRLAERENAKGPENFRSNPEVSRLRDLVLKLADRLLACHEVLGMLAEREDRRKLDEYMPLMVICRVCLTPVEADGPNYPEHDDCPASGWRLVGMRHGRTLTSWERRYVTP